MPTQSSLLRGGRRRWRAGYPPAWPCTPSRLEDSFCAPVLGGREPKGFTEQHIQHKRCVPICVESCKKCGRLRKKGIAFVLQSDQYVRVDDESETASASIRFRVATARKLRGAL